MLLPICLQLIQIMVIHMADDSNKTEKLISSPFKHTNNILSVYYYRVWFYSFYIFIPIFFL